MPRKKVKAAPKAKPIKAGDMVKLNDGTVTTVLKASKAGLVVTINGQRGLVSRDDCSPA